MESHALVIPEGSGPVKPLLGVVIFPFGFSGRFWVRRANLVKQAILGSSMQAKRPDVTSAVVDIVVDKVWGAFKGVMFANVPLLRILSSDDTLRSLRILAVFTCPAPENHKEVREHALKPLGDDAKRILTEQTKRSWLSCSTSGRPVVINRLLRT